MTANQRFGAWLSAVVVALVIFCWVLAQMKIVRDQPDAGAMNVASVHGFLLLYGTLWSLITVIVWLLRSSPPRWSRRTHVFLIVVVAAVSRLVVVFCSEPMLSDDMWRYVQKPHLRVTAVAAGTQPRRTFA